jgi:hypothetical protein
MGIIVGAHDPSAPSGHLPNFVREESSAQWRAIGALPEPHQ